MQLIADGRDKNGKGSGVEIGRKGAWGRKERWNWEKGYERGQGIRMSQDYCRCRNGKGRLKQKCVGRGDPKWVRKEKVKGSRKGRHHKIINNNLHIVYTYKSPEKSMSIWILKYLKDDSESTGLICSGMLFHSWHSLVETAVTIGHCYGGMYLEKWCWLGK